MKVGSYRLQPPPLEDIAAALKTALLRNFEVADVSVVDCPDLRNEPFCLAAPGLSGSERIADIGGQPNLFPAPVLSARYSFLSIAKQMDMTKQKGMFIGAGAGPFFDLGVNSELAPNLSWETNQASSDTSVTNLTWYTRVMSDGSISCQRSPTTNCALMMNLYGSEGSSGPVIKLTARKRIGDHNLTDCIRFSLREHFGAEHPISIGGAFVIKQGTANFHVMPDFPPTDQMPFKDAKQLNDWLTYHDFTAPMVCLTVMHTGDPGEKKGHKLGLRMEHTHCFATHRTDQGGHYHFDRVGDKYEDVEYEGYFNTAKMLFRIDQPEVVLDRDLHD